MPVPSLPVTPDTFIRMSIGYATATPNGQSRVPVVYSFYFLPFSTALSFGLFARSLRGLAGPSLILR